MKKKLAKDRPFLESFMQKAGVNKLNKTNAPRLYYLSGAVTLDPHFKLKFDLAEAYLVARGNLVINPVKYADGSTPWLDAMNADMLLLSHLKTAYCELIQIANRISGTPGLRLPIIALIDLDDRAIPSKGSELEQKFGGLMLPVVKLGEPWGAILTAAIKEAEGK